MKNQALFSSKDKSKKIKCRLLHFFVWRFKGYPINEHEAGFPVNFKGNFLASTS